MLNNDRFKINWIYDYLEQISLVYYLTLRWFSGGQLTRPDNGLHLKSVCHWRVRLEFQ